NLWSRFKACMGYAERLGYISTMPCKALDNPRGKHPDTPFWTYIEFQNFIKSFDLQDYEELQRFTTIWLYYMTGVRVSEGLSL
ncbi:tyrosine-type recombinase/integrase, partial [Streptococcus pyogenes]